MAAPFAETYAEEIKAGTVMLGLCGCAGVR